MKELSKPMTELPLLELDNDNTKQNFLSLNDRIIFQKWHTEITLVINKEFFLIEIASVDSPLLIIKENINCGNFLNDDKFNFLTDRVNYNPLTDFPINKRLYKETLFHIFSQDEIYSNTYMDRIILDFKNILNLTLTDFIVIALIPLLLSKSTKVYREMFVLLYIL